MNSLLYKLKRTGTNQLKKYFKKPATLLTTAAILIYAYFLYVPFTNFINETNSMLFNRYLTFIVLTLLVVINFTFGINSIAKQRAVIFNTADVHFLFSSPISPKMVLLNAYSKNIIISLVGDIIVFFLGLHVMRLSLTTVLLLTMTSLLTTICEMGLIIIIYGKHGESNISKYTRYFVKGIIAFIVGYLLYLYFIKDIGFDITRLMDDPFIFLLPLVGWAMSIYYVILIQPTVFTIIGSFLFVISVLGLALYSWRLSTQGEFYEEAADFAEEYALIIKNAKKGQSTISWKKMKLRKANIKYKGSGAKALLYRQLLEYKKQKFYIFGIKSLVNLIIGVGSAYLIYNNPQLLHLGYPVIYGFMMVLLYISYLSNGYLTKWTKEIAIVYTFLIPDSPLKKLWYSTVIEHVRSLVDGVLIVIPVAIMAEFSILETIGCIGFYVVLQASRLYNQIIFQTIIRSWMGKTVASIVQFLALTIIDGLGFLILVFLPYALSTVAVYILIVYGIIISIIFCVLSSGQFDRMEPVE